MAEEKTPVKTIEQEMVSISKAYFEALIIALEEKDSDIQILKGAVISVFKLIGLTHPGTNRIDEDYLNGKKSIFKPIFKEITNTATDLGCIVMKLPGSSKKEQEMANRFAFMKSILPLLQKYGSEYRNTGAETKHIGE